MDQPLSQKKEGKPRILVAPLDWGLGHATRCIPIIRELVHQDCDVWLAAEGAQEALLKTEFPHLPILPLKGYRVHYAKSSLGLLKNIFFQVPKILQAIKYENKWLKEKVKQYEFDAVISDNRYGLYHQNIPCVFMTHQLMIKSPWGKWTEKVLQKRNYQYIHRFSACWVPDQETEINLAGELSHPEKMPAVPVKYIGWLSRFQPHSIREINNHLLVILSGPEPQRTIFENKMVHQIAHYNGTATIVRGLPASASLIPSTNSLHFYNHLPAAELNNEMEKAEFIIARSGYSTVMDIVSLQKKSILIPTPGQTEQEYLARYLHQHHITLSSQQKNFKLDYSLEQGKNFPYHFPAVHPENKLKNVVEQFVQSLK